MDYFLIDTEDGQETRWSVGPGTSHIGRDPANEVLLQDDSVSRKHAEIVIGDGDVTIRDLGSRNGTTVNGAPLTPGGPAVTIRAGDRIAFGALGLTFASASEGAEGGVQVVGFADDALGVESGRSAGGQPRSSDPPGAVSEPRGHAWVESGIRTGSSESAPPSPSADRRASRSDDLSTTRISWQEIRSEIGGRSTQVQQLFHVLMEAGQMLVLPRSLIELYEMSVDLVSRLVPADRILLLMRDAAGEDGLAVCASRGVDPGADPRKFISRSILRTVLDDHEALLLRDPRSDPRFLGAESIIALRLRSTMTVPLFDNETVIGLLHVDTTNPLMAFDEDQLKTLALFGNLVAVKIKNARLLDELGVKARLEQEMETAAQIQRRLLPTTLPEVAHYRMAARLLPCLETAGDFYDVTPRPDGTIEILVGDVCGKGVGAALLMSHTVSAYRVLSEEGHGLGEVMSRLCCHVYASSDATRFVTLFACRLDPRTHQLTYVNGGHSPVLIMSVDGECTRLPATGPAVGLVDGCSFQERSISLETGTTVCFYTDGIIEAGQSDPYEEERLHAVLQKSRGLEPEQAIGALLEDVSRHTDGAEQDDDITVLVLQRES